MQVDREKGNRLELILGKMKLQNAEYAASPPAEMPRPLPVQSSRSSPNASSEDFPHDAQIPPHSLQESLDDIFAAAASMKWEEVPKHF